MSFLVSKRRMGTEGERVSTIALAAPTLQTRQPQLAHLAMRDQHVCSLCSLCNVSSSTLQLYKRAPSLYLSLLLLFVGTIASLSSRSVERARPAQALYCPRRETYLSSTRTVLTLGSACTMTLDVPCEWCASHGPWRTCSRSLPWLGLLALPCLSVVPQPLCAS